MLKHIIPLAVVLSYSVPVHADYIADRSAAMELVRGRQYEEAMAAFAEMAEATTNERQKSDAFEQAAMCAHRLKQYDQAMELARRIPLAPTSKTVQMRLMLENGKARELILTFKDEDIGSWPEKEAGEAFCCRGRAYHKVKNGRGRPRPT